MINPLKGGTVQVFWNNLNKPKFHSGRNSEQIEGRECLLACSAESLVFQFVIQKYKIKIHSTINLSLVLYERKLVTLQEERRLRVFENRVLWRIFGRKRDGVTGVEKTT